MKKLPGVDQVEARLNEGKTIIKLKPSNQLRFHDLIQVVREKAFTPKEARVSAVGQVLMSGAKPQIELSGSKEVYELTGPQAQNLAQYLGKKVLVQGVIPAPKTKTYAQEIQLASIKPAS